MKAYILWPLNAILPGIVVHLLTCHLLAECKPEVSLVLVVALGTLGVTMGVLGYLWERKFGRVGGRGA